MTPSTAEHPDDMSIEDFEEFARRAYKIATLELINGRLIVKHGPIDVEVFEELAHLAPEGVKLEFIKATPKAFSWWSK